MPTRIPPPSRPASSSSTSRASNEAGAKSSQSSGANTSGGARGAGGKDFFDDVRQRKSAEVQLRAPQAPQTHGPHSRDLPRRDGTLVAELPSKSAVPMPTQPSSRPGMGAIPYDGGTTFRVWAPNAQRVQVAGDFSNWQTVELQREASGNFSLDVPGAKAGEQYQYVVQGKYGDWRWKGDPRANDVTNSTGNSVIVDHKTYQWEHDWDFKMPPWNEAVIYEMHVGTFNDEPGWGPGNWQSAIDKLDHLKDLGINVIEVMPSAEFAADFSWGYNPAYPNAPESAYGTPDDLKRFVDEAHKRGIGVVMDVVYNHLGPSDLPQWDFDGETYGKGGSYFYTDWRAKTPWGDTRPDYGRHEVRDYLRDNAMMWLRDYHMDGLRLDATKEIRQASGADNPQGWQLLKEINEAVNREFPQKIIIAEDLGNEAAVTHAQGAGFDSQWDSNFVHPVRAALTAFSDNDRDMDAVARAISFKYNGSATQRVIYTESHDEVANGKQRLPSEVGGWDAGGYHAKKRSLIGAALTMTSPGIPMIFQGQEFLEDGHFQDGDPLDWKKKESFSGINQAYTDLIKLRRNWNDDTAGLRGENVNVHHVNNNDKVIAFHRWDKGGAGDDTIVVVNFGGKQLSNYELGLPSDGTWKVRFNSDWQGYSGDFGNAQSFDVGGHWGGKDGLPASGALNNLGPYSVVILSKDK
ncbi:alpha amylase C-terminal domain-containing protein [Myxococcus sp. K15C18031901]|uniref:alpha-amylase family glycosyl hydrolase n=1 Tax=Myxococcus dinghuensis TaxID=2906761 RepID=UPI0020A81F46|nr:alpha-amylase family glycosyl hydrolase [Myxococcus dinghuensis]MCP3098027.1 alpha amylase C-terminal domain-containing protein [Myxococcus dinghuensis]